MVCGMGWTYSCLRPCVPFFNLVLKYYIVYMYDIMGYKRTDAVDVKQDEWVSTRI